MVGMLPIFMPILGCRGRNLIGSLGGDGGPPDGPGADSVGAGDGAMGGPDGSVPPADAATDPVPEVIDPQLSRAWTWQPCGTLLPEGPDTAAVIDPAGNIAVLGPRGVRRYDGSGSLLSQSSGPADFLIPGPDGAPLAGAITSSAIVMTQIGAATPLFTFALPKPSTCGTLVSFSAHGDYVLAHGSGAACVWRTSDQALVGNVGDIDTTSVQVGLRGSELVSIERGAQTTDAVTRDLSGRETARVKLAFAGESYLSPSGDRLIINSTLWELDGGTTIPLTPGPTGPSPIPAFSATGDLVLLGGAVFRTSDGVRQQVSDAGSRFSEVVSEGVVLSPDGRRIVSLDYGRATLMDITSAGITAVLGPTVRPGTGSGGLIDHLALSSDGSLLVSTLPSIAAFGIELASTFGDSKVIWNVHTALNLVVDISPDNQLVSIGGDGRMLFSAVDGRVIWPGEAPPAAVGPDICLPERLRFSPKRTWVAGNDYDGKVDVFAVGDATSATQWTPVAQLPAGCVAVAFSRNERLMATSAAALYQTAPTADGWQKLWSTDAPAPPDGSTGVTGVANDVSFSPDETQVMASWCGQDNVCTTNLLSAQTGSLLRTVTELQAPHPSFSPDGSWILAGGTLMHLASGDVRSLDQTVKTTVALFTPEGDIIAGSADHTLTRYCRSR